SFGYGLMVTPLQLARAYATIGSFGIYRPLSITKVDPPVPGTRVFPEPVMKTVVQMMESVALPGGGGTRAAIKGYRVAIKTGTAKKVGDDGKYVNRYIAYTAGVAPASRPRFALVVIINDPQGGKYYGGAISAPVFGAIMGGVLRTMNVEPDALTPEEQTNEVVINKPKEGTSGRSSVS
ncbi:peptidoglycan glycosyltransferase FtsI, partial [Klebsiella pneumoniae]|nr:peptidoglycan glycosyltransferase FtsI [Klebsiella pneumoniae]